MEYRLAQRKCWCRGCDKMLAKDEDKGVFHYSTMNKGMHIIFCEDCVAKMFSMVVKEQLEDKYEEDK